MHACSILRVLARLAVMWAVGVVLAAALLVVLVDTRVVAVDDADGGPVSVSDLADTSLPAIRVLALTGMPISGVQPRRLGSSEWVYVPGLEGDFRARNTGARARLNLSPHCTA
jgi:hypothetical protein